MANFAVLYTSLKNVCPWLELVRFTWEGLIGQQVHYYRKWFSDSGMCFEANDKTKFRVFGTWSIYLNFFDYPSFSHRIRNVSLFTIGTCVCLDFEKVPCISFRVIFMVTQYSISKFMSAWLIIYYLATVIGEEKYCHQ